MSNIFAAQDADILTLYSNIVFHFLPISCIICTSRHTDLFVEVTNISKGNSIWAYFTVTGWFSSQISVSRLIQKEDVQIETFCCIFKHMRVNWSSIICNRNIWNCNNYARHSTHFYIYWQWLDPYYSTSR